MPPETSSVQDGAGETGTCPRPPWHLTPTLAEVRHALAGIVAEWRTRDIPPDLISRAELVLAEVLNNVVEHAMRDVPGGRITVDWKLDSGRLLLCVTDDGRPMPDADLPSGRLPEPSETAADTPEGGYGWFLIRHLVDALTYQRHGGTNRVSITLAPRP